MSEYLEINRSVAIRDEDVSDDSRDVPVAFSSEQPVQDFPGAPPMILLHEPGAADFSRLESIGAVHFNHDTNQIIGRPVDVKIGKDRIARAIVRFDDDEESERLLNKVRSGSLRGVSVGFRVRQADVLSLEAGEKFRSPGGKRFEGALDIAQKWEALEISLTSVPADAGVGVGRKIQDDPMQAELVKAVRASLLKRGLIKEEATDDEIVEAYTRSLDTEPMPGDSNGNGDSNGEGDGDAVATKPGSRSVPVKFAHAGSSANGSAKPLEMGVERERVRALRGLARKYDIDDETLDGWTDKGTSYDDARRGVVDAWVQNNPRIQPTAQLEVGQDDDQKFVEKYTHVFMRRAKKSYAILRNVEVDEEAAQGVRYDLGYAGLARIVLEREGQHGTAALSDYETIRRAIGTGTGTLTNILENTLNKSLHTGFNQARTTYQQWTGTMSLPDFKAGTRPKLSEVANYIETPELVPIPETRIVDAKEPVQLKTYAGRLGVSRQAFINDDLDALARIPAAFGAAGARTINSLVYTRLEAATTMTEDGKALFANDHDSGDNLGSGIISLTSIQSGRELMALQKGLLGLSAAATNETEVGAVLNIVPRFLICHPAQELVAAQVLNTIIQPAVVTNAVPDFIRSMELVVDPYLAATVWYLASDPSESDTIVVASLNGNSSPQLQRLDNTDTLGVEWIAFIDVDAAAVEHRGLYKSTGS